VEGPHIDLDEQGATRMKRSRFPTAVRVTDMPKDLKNILDMGLEEHFRSR